MENFIDLKGRLYNRSVLGDFESTDIFVWKCGRYESIYNYSYKDGKIEKKNLSTECVSKSRYFYINYHDHLADDIQFDGTVTITIGSITNDQRNINIKSKVDYTEFTPSKKIPESKDYVHTTISLEKIINIPVDIKPEDLWIKVLFCKIKNAPIIICSKNLDSMVIEDFFVKGENDLYNSSIDSNVDVRVVKHIVDSNITNIKPKSLNLTYKELSNCYSGDEIKLFPANKNYYESQNSIGIYEHYEDNVYSEMTSYEAIYRRRDNSIDFKLDGWSKTNIDDNSTRYNFYRVCEKVVNQNEDGPGEVNPDPNYTLERIASLSGRSDEADIRRVPDILADIIGGVLFDGKITHKNFTIGIYDKEAEPTNSDIINTLVPYCCKNNPDLINFVGEFPLNSEISTDNESSILHVTAEMYNDHNQYTPNPLWIVMSYKDKSNSYEYYILHDGSVLYTMTMQNSSGAFDRTVMKTISTTNNICRMYNKDITNINGNNTIKSVFIYESPEIEFTVEKENDTSTITKFNSAIYSKKDSPVFIRSEFGCVIPYYFN